MASTATTCTPDLRKSLSAPQVTAHFRVPTIDIQLTPLFRQACTSSLTRSTSLKKPRNSNLAMFW